MPTIEPFEVDVSLVARLLGITRKRVRDRIGSHHHHVSPVLRICPRCMSLGYHARVHQLLRYETCPIHGRPLQASCPHCARPCAYRVSALLIDAPFRCAHCRAYRTYTGTARQLGRPRCRPSTAGPSRAPRWATRHRVRR